MHSFWIFVLTLVAANVVEDDVVTTTVSRTHYVCPCETSKPSWGGWHATGSDKSTSTTVTTKSTKSTKSITTASSTISSTTSSPTTSSSTISTTISTTTSLALTTTSATCQLAGQSCFLSTVTGSTALTVLDNCCVQGACATAASPTCVSNATPTTVIIGITTTSSTTSVSDTTTTTTTPSTAASHTVAAPPCNPQDDNNGGCSDQCTCTPDPSGASYCGSAFSDPPTGCDSDDLCPQGDFCSADAAQCVTGTVPGDECTSSYSSGTKRSLFGENLSAMRLGRMGGRARA